MHQVRDANHMMEFIKEDYLDFPAAVVVDVKAL